MCFVQARLSQGMPIFSSTKLNLWTQERVLGLAKGRVEEALKLKRFQHAVWLLRRGVLGDDELIKVVCGMMRSHLVYEGPSNVREGPSEA